MKKKTGGGGDTSSMTSNSSRSDDGDDVMLVYSFMRLRLRLRLLNRLLDAANDRFTVVVSVIIAFLRYLCDTLLLLFGIIH